MSEPAGVRKDKRLAVAREKYGQDAHGTHRPGAHPLGQRQNPGYNGTLGRFFPLGHTMSTVAVHLDRLLEPLAASLSPEVAAKVADLRADEAMQSRIDDLAERANEGELTAEEREEYAGYLHAIDVIAVLQAKARSLLRKQA